MYKVDLFPILHILRVKQEAGNKWLFFNFQDPPSVLEISNTKIAVFHEPDKIESFLKKDSSIDLIIHGHTHRYRNENIGKIRIINPGECAGIIKGKNSVGAINLEDLSFERIFF